MHSPTTKSTNNKIKSVCIKHFQMSIRVQILQWFCQPNHFPICFNSCKGKFPLIYCWLWKLGIETLKRKISEKWNCLLVMLGELKLTRKAFLFATLIQFKFASKLFSIVYKYCLLGLGSVHLQNTFIICTFRITLFFFVGNLNTKNINFNPFTKCSIKMCQTWKYSFYMKIEEMEVLHLVAKQWKQSSPPPPLPPSKPYNNK